MASDNHGKGWISLYRSITDHWIFNNDKYFKWWVLILFEVNHKPNKFTRNYKVYDIKRGQSVNSLRRWATLFNATPKTVSKFFKMLESDAMITLKKIGKGKQALSLLTVRNYEEYQVSGKQEVPQEGNKEETKGKQRLPTNNNDNNGNNDNKEAIRLKFQEWSKDNDLDWTKVEDQFNLAWDYYTERSWVNKNNDPVENRYMAIRNNWFEKMSEFKKKKSRLYEITEGTVERTEYKPQ